MPVRLKKALPRNVLFVDFTDQAESLRASMLLHPAGPDMGEAVDCNGDLLIAVRIVGTFDDPDSIDGASMRRGTARLAVRAHTGTLSLEFVDKHFATPHTVTVTPALFGFLHAFGLGSSSFDAVTITLPAVIDVTRASRSHRDLHLIG